MRARRSPRSRLVAPVAAGFRRARLLVGAALALAACHAEPTTIRLGAPAAAAEQDPMTVPASTAPGAAAPAAGPAAAPEAATPRPIEEPPADQAAPPTTTPPAAAADGPTPAAPCTVTLDDMACVEGGAFVRGVDEDAHRCQQPDQVQGEQQTTSPAMAVTLSTFYIDRTEVTYEDFRACVAAGACADAGPRYVDFDRPTQPVVGVSWFDARDYCAWAGKRLPTEAEWEKAARGPASTRTPFGDDATTCDVAIIMDTRGRSCGQRKERGTSPETGRVALVGSRAAGHYGAFDMVGNAEEWVADWWSESYEACGDACAGVDPLGPCAGAETCDGHRMRVVRGGSWYWPAEHATGYHRRRHYPSNAPFHHFGFRCAASVEQAATLAAAAPGSGEGADP